MNLSGKYLTSDHHDAHIKALWEIFLEEMSGSAHPL